MFFKKFNFKVDAIFNFIENLSPSQTTGPFVDFCINLFATFKPLELLQFMQNYINNLNNCPSFNIAEALRICTEHGF